MELLDRIFKKSKEMEIMSSVKLVVVFYSMGGTNYQLAKWAKEGAKEADAEVKY